MITIVSGVPRSGTSLLMQMLAAGGMEPLTDGARTADSDNPRGYFEWEPVKQIPERPELIDEAEGKVVKVISQLLLSLPSGREYAVIYIRRPFAEVVRSQAEMIRKRGTAGAAVKPEVLSAALEAHSRQVAAWLERQPHLRVRWTAYHAVLAQPRAESEAIAAFLGIPLDVARMAAQVDPALHRQRLS